MSVKYFRICNSGICFYTILCFVEHKSIKHWHCSFRLFNKMAVLCCEFYFESQASGSTKPRLIEERVQRPSIYTDPAYEAEFSALNSRHLQHRILQTKWYKYFIWRVGNSAARSSSYFQLAKVNVFWHVAVVPFSRDTIRAQLWTVSGPNRDSIRV
jgi:hypothetical protein